MKSIQVFVFNYGLFDNALILYKKFENLGYDTYLLNCAHVSDPKFAPTEKIIMYPNIHYSGQWNEALKLLNADVMLIACSDVVINNLTSVMSKLQKFYNTREDAGIYAPNANWTPWTYDPELLPDLGNGCKEVVGTDSMIWSLDQEVARKVGDIDLGINKIGWGIEILASLYCKKMGKKVVRDYSVTVHHPRSSSYDRSLADKQFKDMINLMPNKYEFWDHYNTRHRFGFGWQGNYKYKKKIKMV